MQKSLSKKYETKGLCDSYTDNARGSNRYSFPMKHLTRLLLFLTIVLFCSTCRKNTNQIIGIKIYDYRGDYNALAAKWKEMGINTSYASTALTANDTFRLALKKNNIQVFIIFPVFQNPEMLQKDSSLYAITDKGLKARDAWVEFVCPSRENYRKAKIAELNDLIQKLDPDGISIDFIRQFVYWEMIYPDRKPESIDRACFCDSCLADFSGQQGIIIPDSCRTTSQKAKWVVMNYSGSWESFRCNLVTTMVKELAEKGREIKPQLIINVHMVPWREGDFDGANIKVAAQDLHMISPYTDFVSPMCYSQMLKRDAVWIADVVTEMNKNAREKVLPSIQVYPEYISQTFTAEDFKQCIEEALKPPSRGVVFFSWPLFEKDLLRMEIAKDVVSGAKKR